MTFEEFRQIASPKTIIPVFERFNGDFVTPVMVYLKMRQPGHHSFLLESVLKGEHLGRYSFIGFSPFHLLKDTGTGIMETGSGEENTSGKTSFFERLSELLSQYTPVHREGLPRFTCGAVGFIGYEMVREYEVLPTPKRDPIGTDNALMAFYKDLIAFDHLKNEVILIANVFVDNTRNLPSLYQDARSRLEVMHDKIRIVTDLKTSFTAIPESLSVNFKKEDFTRAVSRAKEYIRTGDIFQTVLSRRFHMDFSGDAFHIYRSLRTINPSPYLFYLDCGGYQIIGSSPEPLIRCQDHELEIIPIAGTRPRGQSREDDEANSRDLLKDPKEQAEHVMLVDLARNDMGRIAEYGSIRVEDFQTIERYSHVMHIISRVRGHLRQDFRAIDAFKAAFPAGTVSGAPKIRAMEIIRGLEPEKRGIYSGAVGYFDYSGNSDTCIAIRTLIAKNNRLYIQAGAGIVADSIPEKEYEETGHKAEAMLKAIEKAGEGIHDFIH
ncbi:MAG: anthranilate synthase component I [Candidatus Neomarinimicrobiota bacterium]|nr:MAG: anthranilate synthase component I [Candidatus Neomarinimicrobiota bacterium]